jgi:hypothetical protein
MWSLPENLLGGDSFTYNAVDRIAPLNAGDELVSLLPQRQIGQSNTTARSVPLQEPV